VVGVDAQGVQLDGGEHLPADQVLVTTGAAAHPLARRSGLPTEERGFLWIEDTLQVPGEPSLWATGDCALLQSAPWVPRAGVYAVRAGPVLAHNLRAWATGGTPHTYRPQADFLSMLNLGDGTALATKWGCAVRGRWVHRWKQAIDTHFMTRFAAPPGDAP